MTQLPEGYWGRVKYWYFRDHETSGAWGVACAARHVAIGLDKNTAAAIAMLLNGDIDHARDMLAGLPDKMEIADSPRY
jgi:hypothetical protein